MQKIKIPQFLLTLADKMTEKARRISFPGFDKLPLYDVTVFFFKGLQKGSLSTRASSVAFNFFLAIFPAIIFFFTLIPYIPIENFQEELLTILKDMLPRNAYLTIQETIIDIATNKRGGLLSIGFIMALYFSTNGINAMIEAFNATYHSFENRSWWEQRIVSIFLVVILAVLITLAISLIVFSQGALNFLVDLKILKLDWTYYMLYIGRWIVILALFFFAISFLYYLAPAERKKWKLISAGGSLATLLSIIISLGFSFYVNNFGQYNKLYGSIGTLVVVLLWFYFNALVLLIGFELNASIKTAHSKKTIISENNIS